MIVGQKSPATHTDRRAASEPPGDAGEVEPTDGDARGDGDETTRDGGTDPTPADALDGSAASSEVAGSADKKLVPRIVRLRPRWGPSLLTLLVLVAVGLAGGLYFFQYRPDRNTDTSAAQTAIRAASDGTVALLSYSPDTLDRDFATAKSHLTGDFLDYYTTFTTQVVAPAAAQKAVKTSATVVRAAIAELGPRSAVVLVFVDQSTSSTDKPDPTMTSSSVLVTLTKVNDAWLISSFDPV
jgi:Mce-associated membrane protein